MGRLRTGIERLETRYRVKVDPGVHTRTGYLAGPDEARAEAFDRCLADPDVRAIILARGGYGLMRILPLLDASRLRRDPKLVIGFSDATVLAAWALRCAGVGFVHGPMVTQLASLPSEDLAWLFRLLEEPDAPGIVPATLSPIGRELPASTSEPGAVEGRLIGGNLCLLSHLAGTRYDFDYTDAILVIEEVGERPYRVDRDLTHLGLAGSLGALRGAVVGDFLDCGETEHGDHPDALSVCHERLAHHGIAGLRGLPLGHGQRNLAVPLGARVAIDQKHGALHLLEPAVSPR